MNQLNSFLGEWANQCLKHHSNTATRGTELEVNQVKVANDKVGFPEEEHAKSCKVAWCRDDESDVR